MKLSITLLALIISTIIGLVYGQILIGFLIGVVIALPMTFSSDISFALSVRSSTKLNNNSFHYDTSEASTKPYNDDEDMFSIITGNVKLCSFMDIDGEPC